MGENYEKLRNQRIKPFSFLEQERKKRKVPFVYIDVNVGPGRYKNHNVKIVFHEYILHRSGRIGLHEDDDPSELARNFALAFQLSQDMYSSLEELLTTQLESYKAQQEAPEEDNIQEEEEFEN